ncbi:MAG: hypothetical protein J6B83_10155 [Bacteroidaceae bacterium]|nr:hypothetical protein [Bacteroidaceae bacterium]
MGKIIMTETVCPGTIKNIILPMAFHVTLDVESNDKGIVVDFSDTNQSSFHQVLLPLSEDYLEFCQEMMAEKDENSGFVYLNHFMNVILNDFAKFVKTGHYNVDADYDGECDEREFHEEFRLDYFKDRWRCYLEDLIIDHRMILLSQSLANKK